jgi:heat shock protein HslJ
MKLRALLLPLILAACSPTASTPPAAQTQAPPAAVHAAPSTAPLDTSQLARYRWQLSEAIASDGQRIDALFARADQPLQLDFADGRLSVSNACNRMGGSYEIADGRLKLGPMMQTKMACTNPALMALDAAVSARLQGESVLQLQADGESPRLSLLATNGDRLVFVGVPTAATRYGSEGEMVFLEVAAQTAPCSHPLIPDKQCLQVRERRYDASGLVVGAPGEWQALYQDIEGYAHEAGVRNVLRLKRYAVRNPPADGSSVAYVLDMVVESEVVEPATANP